MLMWDWLEAHGLVPDEAVRSHLRRTRPDWLAAVFYPRASLDLLAHECCWHAWSFLVDDQFDDGVSGRDPQRCRSIVAEMGSAMDLALQGVFAGSADLLTTAMVAMLRQGFEGRPMRWRSRFVSGMKPWLATYVAEADDRAAGRVPSPAEFDRHRRVAYGNDSILDFAELSVEADLPDEIRNCSEFRSVRDIAVDCMTPVNDIYSASKDLALGNAHTLIQVMISHSGYTPQAAIDEAALIAGVRLEEYQRAEGELCRAVERIAPAESEHLAKCLRAYRDMIVGNLRFHRDATRYRPDDYLASSQSNGFVPDYVRHDMFRSRPAGIGGLDVGPVSHRPTAWSETEYSGVGPVRT